MSPDTFYLLSLGEAGAWLTQAKACNISINIHFTFNQSVALGASLEILMREMLKKETSECSKVHINVDYTRDIIRRIKVKPGKSRPNCEKYKLLLKLQFINYVL